MEKPLSCDIWTTYTYSPKKVAVPRKTVLDKKMRKLDNEVRKTVLDKKMRKMGRERATSAFEAVQQHRCGVGGAGVNIPSLEAGRHALSETNVCSITFREGTHFLQR
jgi:hypothetical protein